MSSSLRLATIARVSGVLPKKCSRVYAPPKALQFWYSPSTVSIITRRRMPCVSRPAADPSSCPQMVLITFQPAPRNWPSSSWMILPLPRTGPSRRCRLQLTTNTRLSRPSRPATPIAPRIRARRFAVAEEAPHLAVGLGHEAARFQVFPAARLVDRGERPQAHRHRRRLPEIGHQPRMRIAGNAPPSTSMRKWSSSIWIR